MAWLTVSNDRKPPEQRSAAPQDDDCDTAATWLRRRCDAYLLSLIDSTAKS